MDDAAESQRGRTGRGGARWWSRPVIPAGVVTPWLRPALLGGGVASWVAIDVYGRSLVEGDALRVAVAVGVWGLVVGGLWWMVRAFPAMRMGATADGRVPGEMVDDDRGTPRTVAFLDSAGLLAGVVERGLPEEVKADVRAAGLGNFWTQYRAPPLRRLVPPAVVLGGVVLAYRGAELPRGLIHACFMAGGLVLLSNPHNPRPRRMADAYLRHGHCPACAYALRGAPRQPDGCTVCPECGAAWRLARTAG